MSESGEDDGFRGTFWECEDVSGHGVHTMRLSCAEGIAGVEFDEGGEGGNGTVRASLSASNGSAACRRAIQSSETAAMTTSLSARLRFEQFHS